MVRPDHLYCYCSLSFIVPSFYTTEPCLPACGPNIIDLPLSHARMLTSIFCQSLKVRANSAIYSTIVLLNLVQRWNGTIKKKKMARCFRIYPRTLDHSASNFKYHSFKILPASSISELNKLLASLCFKSGADWPARNAMYSCLLSATIFG